MSNFFLSWRVFIAVAVRFILFEFTDIATVSLKVPYTNSLQTDYGRLEECFFLMDKGYDPYSFRLIFHVTTGNRLPLTPCLETIGSLLFQNPQRRKASYFSIYDPDRYNRRLPDLEPIDDCNCKLLSTN